MTTKYRIKGIISAEMPCELCGNANLTKNVVLEHIENGDLLHVGSTCAGYLMLGDRSRKSADAITRQAEAHDYAAKWLDKYGSGNERVLSAIVDQIRVRFCEAHVVGNEIIIGS